LTAAFGGIFDSSATLSRSGHRHSIRSVYFSLRFYPKLNITTGGLPGFFPKLVCSCPNARSTPHATQFLPQLVGEISQALHGAFVFDGLGNSRREFKLMLDLFFFVHRNTRGEAKTLNQERSDLRVPLRQAEQCLPWQRAR
jgi:hypothetical protein